MSQNQIHTKDNNQGNHKNQNNHGSDHFPHLRFPEFTDNWEKKKLGEIFEISAGGDINSKYVSEVKNDIFRYPIFANAEKNKGLYGYSSIFKVNENVLTIAGRGVNIGIAHARKEKFYPIVRLLVLKPKKESSIDFFEFSVNNLNIYVESTGVPQLTAPQISKYKVAFPTLPEQEKIASFLSSVDQKLQLLKDKKHNLEEYKKAIMQQIFSQKLRFKNTDGKDFPNWEEKRLGEIFDYEKGNGLSKEKLIENGKNRCILYGELFTKYKEVVFEVLGKTNSNEGFPSKKGDLLIPCSTTTSGIDLANVTALNFDNILLGGDITILRSKIVTDNIFYAYYLSNFKKIEIASFAQGITIIHLYYNHIKNLKIDYPSLPEQQKIAEFLSAIDAKIEKVIRQIAETQQYKNALLQKMLV